ncbi:MAG: hypothetical protein WCS85_03675 [Candidatus Peribacteraceae bacterium]|jgi:hypothetical protein
MQRSCRQCQSSFDITADDLDLYDKVSPVIAGRKEPVPPPTLCPDCREQRRLAYRNERQFYHRPCAKTGKDVVSIYALEKDCVVYDQIVWWSDDWDQLATGRSVEFGMTFFDQFLMLARVAPRPCIMNMGSENSLYTNHSAYNKNCYMCINTGYSEDCFHLTNFSIHNKDCADCLAIQKCERCVECTETKQCSFSSSLHECINCTDCMSCYDCQGCAHCLRCWNLRHKQYCIENEQLTPEQYRDRLAREPKKWEEREKAAEAFRSLLRERAVHKCVVTEHCEDVSGDHLYNCKDVHASYYTFDSRDCRHCYDTGAVTDCLDALEPYQGELQFETHGCNLGYGITVCSKCYECKTTHYSQYCFNCRDCFGCFGIRSKQYCILNRQYTKEEYERLVPQLIAHMRTTGEWGEFFPVRHTPFAYNETAAIDYFPLTKSEILSRGWQWREQKDEMPKVTRVIPAAKLPESISDIPDDILEWAIECAVTGRPFKIIKQELDFYREMQLPIPHFHPDERHRRRMALRNPRKLWQRKCASCSKDIVTTYAPQRPEIVYCEECYLKEVY